MYRRIPIQCIIPPHMLREIAQRGRDRQRQLAFQNLILSAEHRGARRAIRSLVAALAVPAGTKRRTIYDAQNSENLPGALVRGEGDPPTNDVAVNEAYDGAGATYDFYQQAYGRNSIDNRGMRLDSTIHFGQSYDNAFWNGQQMVYGDGDGDLFQRFTIAVDVIGHELTHGVTQFEAGLEYSGQSGALNESISDVFGSLVKQHVNNQTADKADWLIGAGLFTPNVNGTALRSMKEPGTAYNDPVLGKDPQPANMSDYVNTTQDNGGVHLNSGIPNRAFYLAAASIGGFAWEKTGLIWYTALPRLQPTADFQSVANTIFQVAGELYGSGSPEQQAVENAWNTVGIAPQTARATARARS